MSYFIQQPKFLLAVLFSLITVSISVKSDSPKHSKYCMSGSRYFVGLQEQVNQVGGNNTRLNALIDSGSTLSSMDAKSIQLKTKNNGDVWVYFQIPRASNSDEMVSMARPLKRFAFIQTHHGKPQKRPVIETKIQLGPIETTTDFSLTSRSRFKNPILLGINTLKEIAIIDLSQEFLLNKSCSTTLTSLTAGRFQ